MAEDGYDILKILELLPHRHPVLMVDRVLEIQARRLRAIKNLTYNEAFFQGHFPSNPVMPGVLILEALAQAGGILIIESLPQNRGRKPYLVGVDRVRFRKPVVPGDQLLLDVELVQSRSYYHRIRGEAHVAGERVAEAALMLAALAAEADGGVA